MKIFQHHHIGKHSYQEDALGHNAQAFVICDGVGGHGNGDLASQTVLHFLLEATQKNPPESTDELKNLILEANQKLNLLLDENPEKEGMGTTLVAIFKLKDHWYSAHIGDSRLYWVRPKARLFWHTWDHSFVANLVKMGEITREVARKHPRSNEIQKAVLANSAGQCTTPEIRKLGQPHKGDIMLLCSDGMNEAWSDEELLSVLFDMSLPTADKAQKIFNKCQEDAHDNNTAFLIEWNDDVHQEPNAQTVAWMSLEEATPNENLQKLKSEKKWWKLF